MKILYIAYSCSPIYGSEDAIGWNVPYFVSKYHDVWVITKPESERGIVESKLEIPATMHMVYCDIPAPVKMVFRSSLYSGRLFYWMRKALKLAEQLNNIERFDVIHQITPVEFRAVLDCSKFTDSKVIIGPIGGCEYIPAYLQKYARKSRHVELIRRLVNESVLKGRHFRNAIRRADILMFANVESYEEISKKLSSCKIREKSFIETEIAIGNDIPIAIHDDEGIFTFSYVGRLTYRKGLQFLIDVLEKLDNTLQYRVLICGEGKEKKALEESIIKKGLSNKCFVIGNVPYNKIGKIYEKTDVLLFPSIRETTGSVVLEAMIRGIPVLSNKAFGAGQIINCENGYPIEADSYKMLLQKWVDTISWCILHKDDVRAKGNRARISAEEYTWDRKVEKYMHIYAKICNSEHES